MDMEEQVRIKRIVAWTHPYFGNDHTMPYGTLEVTDGETTKLCRTKGDTVGTFDIHGCQYITFKRKPYKLYRDANGRLSLVPIV